MEAAGTTAQFEPGMEVYFKNCFGVEVRGRIVEIDRVTGWITIGVNREELTGPGIMLTQLQHVSHIVEHAILGWDEVTLRANEMRQAELEMERLVIGFTVEAELIYDALSKTFPVRWDGTVIVVMNKVRVISPYTPDSVIGGTEATKEQVRRVLEFERQRLQIR